MKKEETKQKLIEATLNLISEKGYLGATTREIAQTAGVTELTLFRHFGSKEKLFEEVLRGCTFLPTLRELLPELDRLEYQEALNVIATRYLLSLKERKAMVRILLSEVITYPDKVRTVYNQFIEEVRSVLASYFRGMRNNGHLRAVTPETAARIFLGMLFNYFRNEEIMRDGGMTRQAMEQDIREMVDIFTHGTIQTKENER